MRCGEFHDLTAILAREAAEQPLAFRSRLMRWTIGAHLAVVFFALLPVITVGGLIGFIVHVRGNMEHGGVTIAVLLLMGLVLWGFLFIVLRRAFAVPGGLDISREESPALYAELEVIRGNDGSCPFDAVLLSFDCNAQVCSGPRPGVSGRRRYLVLGVPLLLALPPDEMRAVLAHEFAHRAERDWLQRWADRVVNWIDMQLPGTAPHARARGLFDAPLAWFAPRFRALWLVRRRTLELHADAAGAACCGAESMAAALVRLSLLQRLQSEWIDSLLRVRYRDSQPPESLPDLWRQAVAECPSDQTTTWLEQILRQPTLFLDLHPSLSDRLRALRVPMPVSAPSACTQNAFDVWCGDQSTVVLRKFATWWKAVALPQWSNMREQLKEAQSILDSAVGSIDVKADSDEHVSKLWDRAFATLQLKGPAVAESLLADVLHIDPAHPQALRWIISRRLEGDDTTAAQLIDQHPSAQVREALWIEAFASFARKGDEAGMRRALDAVDIAAGAAARETAIRQCTQFGDVFMPHGLSAESIAVVAERAAVMPWIETVAVVRKKLPSAEARPMQVVVVRMNSADIKLRHDTWGHIDKTLQALKLQHDWQINLILPGSRGLAALLFDVPEAILYDRRHATR